MKVLKFGSSALSSAKQFQEVASIIMSEKEKKIVVLPAMEGTSFELSEIADYLYKKNVDGAKELISMLEQKYIQCACEIFSSLCTTQELKKQEICATLYTKFDEIRGMSDGIFTKFEEKRIIAVGAHLSSFLMEEYLKIKSVPAVNLSALSFMKITKDEEPDDAFIKSTLNEELSKLDETVSTIVTEGSICMNAYNEVDSLGMGGNDYTAALIGAAIRASVIEFWNDSVGLYNNNPNIVKDARPVESISFDEAAELSYFLTRIIHPTSILPAKLANVPVRLRNIEQADKQGTIISTNYTPGRVEVVASKDGITAILIKSSRMLCAHGFLRRIFEVFEKSKTAIDMITTSEVGVSVTIDNDKNLNEIIDELKKFGTVSYKKEMTIVSVIGHLPDDNVGFQSNILAAFKEIPIRMISYGGSSHNISFLIQTKDKTAALQSLNKQLFN